jgi:hypothetical protein
MRPQEESQAPCGLGPQWGAGTVGLHNQEEADGECWEQEPLAKALPRW